ncbi:MAG: phosphoribosylglycinamide formyltransferase [Candidatus Glassbacteria bacterium RIFCSPLOWO2_12_FULL_58_11]|uniref:Phosphoribosylglycinamide formyltransferase n=1 Tax=Candidatus Glassbacteria bacterium RIFCSPLOWO2_12_FULL_58_11 TaxID=1817867 RepID=A0A1F5YLN5_9BACT|nr:MAG: phosphoribosylglycinamide formyltransferase [Candidatus Glassbacteria bacterium RIFCSPLOWO2_12_FULL_58_11]
MSGLRVAVMASGGGTNLQQLLDRFPGREAALSSAEVCLVVTNRPGVGALERAERAAVPSAVVDPAAFDSPEAFGQRLIGLFKAEGIDLIVLAGYLKMLPPNLVAAFSNRIINIHPALLPLFGGQGMYGRKVHEAVLAAGVKVSGPTVHFVNEQYDKGPIIAQRTVPVYHTDTPEELAGRVLEAEHEILPEVVALIAEGRVKVVDGIVQISQQA